MSSFLRNYPVRNLRAILVFSIGGLGLVSQRMQIADEAFQALFEHMSINLRGRDVGMAEQRLHHAQVCAIVQKMAGEGMAQDVRAQLR